MIGLPARYGTHRLATHDEHDIDYAAAASCTDRDPALLVPFDLVFREDVLPRQDIFGVGTGDPMSCQMLFIMFVPVELAGFPPSTKVYIKCMYNAISVQRYWPGSCA